MDRQTVDRDAIIAAARKLGVDGGWSAVTVRALTRSLGYTAPIVYEHFDNKRDVLTQVAVKAFADLNNRLELATQSKTQPAILGVAQEYWRFMVENQQIYRLMNGMVDDCVNTGELAAAAASVCNATERSVRAWMKAERSTVRKIKTTADQIWALLHGMATLHMGRAANFTEQEAKDTVLRLLLGAASQSKRGH